MATVKVFALLGLFIVFLQVSPARPEAILELEELKIEGYIYEPQVLFILEQPSLDLITTNEERRHSFLDGFDAPLFEAIYPEL